MKIEHAKTLWSTIRQLFVSSFRIPHSAFRILLAAPPLCALLALPQAGAAKTGTGNSPEKPATAAATIAPMSHLDLTFMGTVEECLSRGGKVLAGALNILDTQPDFRFLLEYVLFLEAYREAQPEAAARLDDYIRAGRVELGAQWSGIYVIQEDEEDLIRNVLYAKAYARERYGIELETLQLTDIPGVVPQLPQLCAGLGIRNLVLTRCAPPDTLFWYEAPGGARVLTWSAKGYNQAGGYGAHLDAATMRKRGLAARLAKAAAGAVPPLFYYGSDQWLPPAGMTAAVRAWNAETTGGQQLTIATPTAYFRALRAAGLAGKAPVLRGELPSTWLYLDPAHAHVSRWDAPAARALDAAERLSTLAWLRADLPYPRAELDALWRAMLLARDHNYGGKGAGGGQARKYAERRNVEHRGRVLASRAMAAIAGRVEAPRESAPIVVFNTLNWARSDLVRAHVTFYPAADSAQRDVFPRAGAMILRAPDGQPTPFQITADRRDTLGEFDLAFVARDVPGLGYAGYTLEPATAAAAAAVDAQGAAGGPRAAQRIWFEARPPDFVLENGAVRLAIDRASGKATLTSLRGAPAGSALVVSGLGLNGRRELPEVERTPPLGLSVDDPAREVIEPFVPADSAPVRLLAEGPVLATAVVRGSVLGAPAELRYTLYRGLPWVDAEVWIDWDLRRFGRVELAYEVPLRDARAAYGLPFGAGAFGAGNLLPGSGPGGGDEGPRTSWEQIREISRWLDVAGGAGGVTMATSHRWTRVEPGAGDRALVRCCLLRGGRMRPADPAAAGDDPRSRLAFQFRFQPHGGSWQAARAPRIGWEAAQPLLAYTVNDTWSEKTLPRQQALATVGRVSGKGDGLLTCLKQAEDGQGIVARWYEPSGQPCRVRVAIPATDAPVRQTDLLEKPLVAASGAAASAGDGSVSTTAWEIVTVRTGPPKIKH